MNYEDLEDLSHIKPLLEEEACTDLQSWGFDLKCSIAISLKRIANALEEQLICPKGKKPLDPSGEK